MTSINKRKRMEPRLKLFLTGVFNSEVSDNDNDGKKGVKELINKSNNGTVVSDLKNCDILVIGSFPGEKKIEEASKISIPIINFEILQQGLKTTTPRKYFEDNKLPRQNALNTSVRSGEEDVIIQSGLLNFRYEPDFITEEEEFKIIESLKQCHDKNENLVFDKNNKTKQSFGFGAKGIEYNTDFKTFPERDWSCIPELNKVVARVNDYGGKDYSYVVTMYYPNGLICMTRHKDKEAGSGLITSISLGESTRKLKLANNHGDGVHIQELLPRSIYQLRPPTNKHFTHEILESDDGADDTTERWSLNFRYGTKVSK